MTSYKTRQSSYGDPTGCVEGTRVKVLEDLDNWASGADGSKVYWMVGMAGIGKSTIAHTFCEILEAKNILGGNFFASRASEKTNNARLIVPVIAHALARASPPIKIKVVKAIDDDPTLAESTYINMNELFKQLIYNPVRATTSMADKPCKVVVIDAIDECADPRVVSSFIKLVLKSASELPLKIFISSRDESPISNAFNSADNKARNFYLHEIEKDVVQKDIQKYLMRSLANIRDEDPDLTAEDWPLQPELDGLIARSGTLFIYAATAVRYIGDGLNLYKSRLSEMATQGLESIDEFQTALDALYLHILVKACKEKRNRERDAIRELLSIIIFLRYPLHMEAIASLSEIGDARLYLSTLASVIHTPKQAEAVVAPFHASFPNFITSPERCSSKNFPSFHSLVATDGHELLALKCLKLMNRLLKYNICEISEDLTHSRIDRINSPENIGKISEALKYSCLHWADHLEKIMVFNTVLVEAIRLFLHEHLLYWIECLSALGEIQAGLKSLSSIEPVLSTFKYDDFQSLVYDARRCLQMNFEGVQKHCMEIYQSALVWLPKKSLIRKTYIAHVRRAPKVILGLSDVWGPTELVMSNESAVYSVAFSQDGSRVVSGSYDKTVRIWNVKTGEVEAELQGHTGLVNSVAFSQDGNRIVSGSYDNMIRIWNAEMSEVEAKLEGHTDGVISVAFSQDGSRVVSGSNNDTVRIWKAKTGEVEAELKGYTGQVMSVAFSHDGSRVVSGLSDNTVRIWNVKTREVEAELEGHTSLVKSVAFSQDGSQVVSGSDDNTVRIWNVTTGEVEAELEGHTSWVISVAFSQDGSRVVSESNDDTVRIWNATTGTFQIMTTSDFILPDSGKVEKIGTRTFRIINPLQQPTLTMKSALELSDDHRWIVGTHCDCWIPSFYCNFYCSSVCGSRICLGYPSGRIVILDLASQV